MGDGGGLYNMDDAYIEQKYVRAEEERQRQEADRKRQQALDEQEAFVQADKKRKEAEADRMRRKAEEDAQGKLDAAKKHRQEEDRVRKEKESSFNERLAAIEHEIQDLDNRKGGIISDRLDMEKDGVDEERKLQEALNAIVKQREEIQQQEELARAKVTGFKSRTDAQKLALEKEEQIATEKQKALNAERRKVQNDMLEFLKDPTKFLSKPKPKPEVPMMQPNPAFHGGSVISHPNPYQPQPGYGMNPNPGYPGGPNPGFQPGYNPAPAGYNPNPGGYNPYQPAPSPQPYMTPQPVPTPQYPEMGMVNPAPTAPTPEKDAASGLEEQLKMLDDLLSQGIMTKDEYQANKKEALKAAGVSDTPTGGASGGGGASSAKSAEVQRQLAQLDEYLKTGVLQQEEYNDAKTRVLQDSSDSGAGSRSKPTTNIPIAPVANSMLVEVVVPPNKRPGDSMLIAYQGKEFNVVVPPGMGAGSKFHASIPA